MLYFYIAVSVVADFLISYFCIVDSPSDLWKCVVLFPLLFLCCLTIHFVVFILYSLTADKEKDVTQVQNSHKRFMLCTLKLFFKLGRVSYEIENEELIPNDDKYLFVCNHISIFDPIISFVLLGKRKLAFVSKKENVEIPFAGRYMHKAGCIPLDRENNREAVKSINKAAQYISDGICAIGIYPEGYVNKSGKGLLEFRNGAFKIAKKAHTPIVVAVIKNTRDVNDKIFRHKTKVTLKIAEVIEYDEISKMKTVEISEKVREIMKNNLRGV